MIAVALAACLSAWYASVGPESYRLLVNYAGNLRAVAEQVTRGTEPGDGLQILPAHLPIYLRQTPLILYARAILPIQAAATLAGLVYRFRRPRPPWSRIVRQPGALACLVVAVVTLLEIQLHQLDVPLPTWPTTDLAVAVAASWSVLRLSGRWAPEPGWIDRLGRLAGASWIITGAIATCLV